MRFQYVYRFGCRAVAARGAVGLLPTLAVGMCITTVQPMSALPARLLDDTVYTLERVYNKGDVDRYSVKTEVDTNGSTPTGAKKMLITMVLKEQTTEVKPNGNAVVNDTFEQASLDIGDNNNQDITAFLPAITQTRDKQAHILETKNAGGNPEATGMVEQYAKQLISFYPGKPVKVGDSWDMDVDDTKSVIPSKAKSKGTLIAIEPLNGTQTAKIKVVTDASGEAENQTTHVKTKISTHFEGTANMDLKTGKVLLMTAKTTFMGGPFTGNKVEWKLKTGDDK